MSNIVDRSVGKAAPVATLALERITRSPAALVENLPIGIYTCDRDGLLVQFNRRAAELWGRMPVLGDVGERYCGAPRMLDRNGVEIARADSPMAQVLATGEPVRDREMMIETEAGERIAVLANVDPIRDEQGHVVGGVNCFQDISELTRMRSQMREGRRVVGRVLESLPVAIYTTDAEGRLTYFNKAAETLWGVTPAIGEQLWCGSWKIYLPDGTPLPHDQCPMAVALREQRALAGPEAVAERPDGTRVPFFPHPTPIFDSAGKLIGGVNMLVDLTEQKRHDTQQRGLIDELNHRVKNSLATIQSLAAQTMRGSQSSDGREFEGRLMALSRVHDQLTRNAWESADFADIVADTFAPCRGSANSHVRAEGPSVALKSRAALAMGMVLHELARNAAHHGALSSPAGSVALTWRTDGKTLFVDWRESDGPAVVTPRKRGFGTRLLERSIAHELGGKPVLEFTPDGVHCTMEIPLPG